MIRNLKFYVDAGHGWLAVKYRDLELLGITERISIYSYHKGQTVYLEEDCDASVYLDAAKAAGWTVTHTTVHHNDLVGQSGYSPIRYYPGYHVHSLRA